jgi:hypothetical protein
MVLWKYFFPKNSHSNTDNLCNRMGSSNCTMKPQRTMSDENVTVTIGHILTNYDHSFYFAVLLVVLRVLRTPLQLLLLSTTRTCYCYPLIVLRARDHWALGVYVRSGNFLPRINTPEIIDQIQWQTIEAARR